VKAITKFWRAESALIVGIALALAGAGLVPGVWGKVILTVLPLLGAGAVRKTVWAPDTVANTVENVATSVASQLNGSTAGGTGHVTIKGQAIVDGVVAGALGEQVAVIPEVQEGGT
jgi:hypothetical protein